MPLVLTDQRQSQLGADVDLEPVRDAEVAIEASRRFGIHAKQEIVVLLMGKARKQQGRACDPNIS